MGAFIAGAWSFLTGPVGRWLVAALAVIALLVGVHHHGFKAGVAHEKAAQAERLAKARKEVAKREAKAGGITDQARASHGRELVRIQTRTVTLIKEVPTYVSPAADTRCVIPVGFVRIHDAAAAGSSELSTAAGGPLDAPSGIELSSVADTLIGNYGVAYQWRAEALTWRAWYARQKAAWDAPPPP